MNGTALQEFIAAIQVFAGFLLVCRAADIPKLLMAIADKVPAAHEMVSDRFIRTLLLDVVCRTETALDLPQSSVLFSQRLTRITTAGQDILRRQFLTYIDDVAGRVETQARQLPRADERIDIALVYIRSNYASPWITVGEVARAVRLSRWHLERLLRQQTGRTYLAHLHAARLTAACRMLRNPTLSVKEIAAATGYSSVTVFDRHFRREFGSTPKCWRAETSRFADRRPFSGIGADRTDGVVSVGQDRAGVCQGRS